MIHVILNSVDKVIHSPVKIKLFYILYTVVAKKRKSLIFVKTGAFWLSRFYGCKRMRIFWSWWVLWCAGWKTKVRRSYFPIIWIQEYQTILFEVFDNEKRTYKQCLWLDISFLCRTSNSLFRTIGTSSCIGDYRSVTHWRIMHSRRTTFSGLNIS